MATKTATTTKLGNAPRTFQQLIFALQRYWSEAGCVILQPYDMPMGAGTFHTATFLRAIGPEPWSAAYVQPSRRPTDGRYGENPFRLQHYYQLQVIIKPSPLEILDLYLGSLRAIGIDPLVHDIRFVEDNWESPTLGAWGLGWEVWLNGMEITQFTYFQQVGGLDCRPVAGEITYGPERLAMYVQGVQSIYDVVWTEGPHGRVTYGDIYHQNEVEQSKYNFERADVPTLFRHFDDHETQCKALLEAGLALPAYEQVMGASHTFNLLDARRAISVTERQRYILRVRTLARAVAQAYYNSREALGFPLGKASRPAVPEVPKAASRTAGAIERRDFLVELGTEELPPKTLRELEEAFANEVRAGLAAGNLVHGDVISFATPRRLALHVKRLVSRQPEQSVKRRGPPASAAFDASGQPTRAALAFAESCGTTVDALQRLEEGKGTFLFFIGTKAGSNTVDLLPGIVNAALTRLPIAKRMRWGAGEAEFVRPVHWLVMLYGKDVIPTNVLDTLAGNMSRGHRFLAPKPLRITSPASYARALRERGRVIASFAERRDRIQEGVLAAAAEIGGKALITPALLDEVTALVEWPVPIAGRFDDRFLQLPREVLISTLQDHQRYFAIENADGTLLPWFITVSNLESQDPTKVREGNERVVRPRLADAAFFWEQDRKQPLAARREALDAVTFQKELGSTGNKVRRIRTLAGEIAETGVADRATAERAAELCKCDLLTAVVGEFPELQGVMGGYYALADNESADVAAAVREHYQPRGAGDDLPASAAGTVVSIADKLDTLAGIFAIGQKPTGTKDPFGLRRAAIGILRMAIEKKLDLDLRALIDRAVALQPVANLAAADDIYDYVMERLRAYYLEHPEARGTRAITSEMFDAVLATKPHSPLDFDARLRGLSAFLELPESGSLTAANKRIANILRKTEQAPPADVNVELLREEAEIRLFDSMHALKETVATATARREYAAALGQLAQLRTVVDAFFDQVMVMADDLNLRDNRLALLAQLRGLFGGVADLSRLPG